MVKILFVCSGNVGRSQMAEAYYNHFTKSRNASSAGTDSETPKKYSALPHEIIMLMKEESVDVSKNKVKLINDEMIKNADKIMVMCEKNKCPEMIIGAEKTTFWEVTDPYKAKIDDMRKIRNIIKAKVLSLL